MSKVLETVVPDVIDYCANEACGAEILEGQPVTKIGHELVCSGKCLMQKIGAVTIIAGKDVLPSESDGIDSSVD
ncbi:hypothetical protein J2TS6_55200 [Paenibacillus albilobatus]|uniref:Uncharacterized protein n=1 Tax=Paenibacillus albilobatus TaxID=2716884 RepID=A0A919XMB8_9BACL|nr:hypothetical protein [Paenibacillus albilobatus]GIO34379.1 hypothetical protein J2TS6_55200 [Paenibacillus albilobatus]